MPRRKAVPASPVVAAVPAEIPPPPVPAAPIGPSPAVLELQGDIVNFVRERSTYRRQVAAIQAELFAAQAKFQATQATLQQFEQEIQERMNLIAQLENRAPAQANVLQFAPREYPVGAVDMSGISAEPTRSASVPSYASDPNDMVNRSAISRAEVAAVRAQL